MKEFAFEIEMKVRDYECDLQGVVNNSNYQHYMEHARHEFLETTGTSFSALHDQGIDVMVSRIDISYKHSLRGSEKESNWCSLKIFTKSRNRFYAPGDESKPSACKTVNLPAENFSKRYLSIRLRKNKREVFQPPL